MFRDMLTSGQYVILVQDSVLIGEQARDLLWVHGISLKGADAVHVASAVAAGCSEFVTFDSGVTSKASELNAVFGLKIVAPRESTIIPQAHHPDAGPLFTAAEEMRSSGAGDKGKPDDGDDTAPPERAIVV